MEDAAMIYFGASQCVFVSFAGFFVLFENWVMG